MAKNNTNTDNTPESVTEISEQEAPVAEVLEEAEDERVEVRIPRGSEHGDPNVFVGINGTNYILPRGKTSLVPRFVKEELDRSDEAAAIMDDNKTAMLNAEDNK